MKGLIFLAFVFQEGICIGGDDDTGYKQKLNKYREEAKFIVESDSEKLLNRIQDASLRDAVLDELIKYKAQSKLDADIAFDNLFDKLHHEAKKRGVAEERLKIATLPIQRLGLKYIREKLERVSWPDWLIQENPLDQFESWVMAWAVVPGYNLDQMRDEIRRGSGVNQKNLTYEAVAAGICDLNANLADAADYAKLMYLDISVPNREPEITETCTRICQGKNPNAEEVFACKLLYSIHSRYNWTVRYKGRDLVDAGKVLLYGRITKLKNCTTAENRITQEFKKDGEDMKNKPASCSIFSYVVDGTRNPTSTNAEKVKFIVFRATCNSNVKVSEFREFITLKLKEDSENKNVKIDFFEDSDNPVETAITKL